MKQVQKWIAIALFALAFITCRPGLVTAEGGGDPDGWEICKEFLTDSVYLGDDMITRENGYKEISTDTFEMFQISGIPEGTGIFLYAFNEDEVLIDQVDFSEISGDPYYYISPKSTTKITIATGKPEKKGETITADPVVKRRRTGKVLSIMGDSISTFKGFLPTERYDAYYTGKNSGVASPAELWWGIVAREMGYQISTINAWSGSRVTTLDRIDSAMCMARTAQLSENGEPDIIIILGGINDFIRVSPLGTWSGKSPIPRSSTSFREAYAMMLDRIQKNYPLAQIYCCTLPVCEWDAIHDGLENNEGQYLHEFNEAIRDVALILNCDVIELNACGINRYNIDTYLGDYYAPNQSGLHPNAAGQRLMAEKIIQSLK